MVLRSSLAMLRVVDATGRIQGHVVRGVVVEDVVAVGHSGTRPIFTSLQRREPVVIL